MTCNASGVGVILIAPQSAMYNDTLSMAHSIAGSTGSTLAALANSLAVNYRAPFAKSADIDARLVGCGVRIKYVGKYLDTSGLCGVGIRQTTLENLALLNPDEFLSRPSTVRSAVTHGGKWTQLAHRPTGDSDLLASSHEGTAHSHATMAIVVTGAQPSAPFEVEVCFFHEYYSSITTSVPSTTLSHSDVPGFGAVRDYINTVWNSPITSDLYNKGMDFVYKKLTGVANDLLKSSASTLMLTL
jgi:hypothetical protein